MVQWFKKKEPELSITFDQVALKKKASKNLEKLWEMRGDQSYKVLLEQIQIAKNIYILSLGDIKPDEHASHNIASIKGGIKALEWFQASIDMEFDRRRKIQESQGQEDSYSKKIIGNKRPRARPAI